MDPNEIIGTPREYEVWLAPDWSTFDEKVKPPNATRVSVRETRYKDGRVVTQVLDENRAPISTRTLEETMDKDQERRWKDQQAQEQRQTDQGERRVVSVVFEGSGKDRKRRTVYASGPDKVEDAPDTTTVTTEKEWHTEGTPDGNGGFDNSRPIMVRTVNGKREERQPNGAELKDWNEAQQRQRNPGGKTDDEIQAEKDKNKPGAPTLKPDGKGGTIAVQTMPDGTIKTTPLPGVPSDKPNPERVTVDGVVYERNPDTGTYAPAAGLPQSSTNKPIPGDAPVYAPRQESPDLGLTEYARSVRQRTDLSKEAQDQLIREAHATAGTVVSRGTAIVNAQENTRQAGLTQRGQDVQLANQRLSTAGSTFGNALTAANDATKYSVGPDSSAVLPYYLMLAQQNGANYGGLVNPAPVGNGPAIQQMQGQSLPGVAGLLATSASGPFANGAAGAAAEEAARQAAAAQAAAPGPQPPVRDDHRIPAPAPSPAPPVPPAQQPVAPAPPISQQARDNYPQTERGSDTPAPVVAPPAPVEAPQDGIGPSEPVGGVVLPQPAAPVTPPDAAPPAEAPPDYATSVSAVNRATGERKWFTRETWDQFKRNNPIYWVLWAEDAQPLQTNEQPAGHNPYAPQATPANVVPRPEYQTPTPQPVAPDTSDPMHVSTAPVQGGSVASMLGAGPWQQPAPAPTTGAVGTQMMAAQGAYDPTDINQQWLDAGMDPAVVAMFGGGRQRVA